MTISKVSAADLQDKEQLAAASEAIGRTLEFMLEKGFDQEVVLAALVSYTTNLLMKSGNAQERQKTIEWLRDIASIMEQQPRLN